MIALFSTVSQQRRNFVNVKLVYWRAPRGHNPKSSSLGYWFLAMWEGMVTV